MTPEQQERRARMLAYVRDVMIERAHSARSWHEFAGPMSPEWEPEDKESARKAVVALEAAADILIYLHAEWLKTGRTERGIPAWLVEIGDQATSAFKAEFLR